MTQILVPQSKFVALLLSIPRKKTQKTAWRISTDLHYVSFRAGMGKEGLHREPFALPWGIFPRRLLLYLCNEYSKTSFRKIPLGKDKSGLLHAIGYSAQGYDYARLITQFDSLKHLSYHYHSPCEVSPVWLDHINQSIKKNKPFEDRELFTHIELWESNAAHVVLDIEGSPFVDFEVVKSFGSNLMKLDFYVFLADRLHRLPPRKKEFLSWLFLTKLFATNEIPDHQLKEQVRKFKNKFTKDKTLKDGTIKKSPFNAVLEAYPTAKVKLTKEGLILQCSPAPVSLR